MYFECIMPTMTLGNRIAKIFEAGPTLEYQAPKNGARIPQELVNNAIDLLENYSEFFVDEMRAVPEEYINRHNIVTPKFCPS